MAILDQSVHGPTVALQWRHNEHDAVSNHQPHECLLNCIFRRRWKKTSKRRVTGLCEGNSLVTGEFPAQRASNAENVSIWWRHHGLEDCPGPRFNRKTVFPVIGFECTFTTLEIQIWLPDFILGISSVRIFCAWPIWAEVTSYLGNDTVVSSLIIDRQLNIRITAWQKLGIHANEARKDWE